MKMLVPLLLAMTPLSATVSGQGGDDESIRDRFIGAWRLVWLEEAGADGTVHRADCAIALLGAAPAQAQEPIADNSFLVEEAYNQERGVVQHINTFSRVISSGDWIYTFTQEWPLPGQRHQVSYTLPVQRLHAAAAASTGVGDAALNYRFQALGIDGGRVAFAPRLSLLMPTGQARHGLGSGGVGFQVNLPLSWSIGNRLVTHWNAGATHTFRARDAAGDEADTDAFALAQSVVWLARPRVNLLLETSFVRGETVSAPGATERADALFVSPGIRWAHNLSGGMQIVPGLAFPIGLGPSRGKNGVFVYFSLEHRFRAAR